MRPPRLRWRRGDGSAAVRGWVALYTLGLPVEMRMRRGGEVRADLADEALHAMRTGRTGELFGQRLIRLTLGIPSDLSWRIVDAPAIARRYPHHVPWVPLDRWTFVLLAMVAIGAAGAFAIVTVPDLTGPTADDGWHGWGPAGFGIACAAIMLGVIACVPWPRRGAAIVIPAVVLGFLASPWLWGCWFLAFIGVSVRLYQADPGAPRDLTRRE
jgi:hypothetical protein